MTYFHLKEFIKSDVAKAKKIDNTPPAEAIHNLEALVTNVLDPIREAWGAPIIVTSGYRSKALNKAVGGAATSQHLNGEAADITTGKGQKANAQLLVLIRRLGLDYDQLINEDSDRDGNPNWVHISYRRHGGNRRQYITLH